MRPCANCKEDLASHSEGKAWNCLAKLSAKSEDLGIINSVTIGGKTYTLRDIEQGEGQ